MKEYLVMMFVFMVAFFLFGWLFGPLLISWLIVGRATLYNKGVNLSNDGIACYLSYLAWPFYLYR